MADRDGRADRDRRRARRPSVLRRRDGSRRSADSSPPSRVPGQRRDATPTASSQDPNARRSCRLRCGTCRTTWWCTSPPDPSDRASSRANTRTTRSPSATIATSGAATLSAIGFGFATFEKNSTNAARPVGTIGLCWMYDSAMYFGARLHLSRLEHFAPEIVDQPLVRGEARIGAREKLRVIGIGLDRHLRQRVGGDQDRQRQHWKQAKLAHDASFDRVCGLNRRGGRHRRSRLRPSPASTRHPRPRAPRSG